MKMSELPVMRIHECHEFPAIDARLVPPVEPAGKRLRWSCLAQLLPLGRRCDHSPEVDRESYARFLCLRFVIG